MEHKTWKDEAERQILSISSWIESNDRFMNTTDKKIGCLLVPKSLMFWTRENWDQLNRNKTLKGYIIIDGLEGSLILLHENTGIAFKL